MQIGVLWLAALPRRVWRVFARYASLCCHRALVRASATVRSSPIAGVRRVWVPPRGACVRIIANVPLCSLHVCTWCGAVTAQRILVAAVIRCIVTAVTPGVRAMFRHRRAPPLELRVCPAHDTSQQYNPRSGQEENHSVAKHKRGGAG